MKVRLIKFLALLVFPLLISAMVHKFYVSVTNVEYVEKQRSFQITTRIFIDDLDALLAERYGVKAALATENEAENSNELISKYLDSKFEIKINGVKMDHNFLGKEYQGDLIICYLEITEINLDKIRSIEIRNDVLTELFTEQQNVVHLKIGSKKKTYILVRLNNKGMLNL